LAAINLQFPVPVPTYASSVTVEPLILYFNFYFILVMF